MDNLSDLPSDIVDLESQPPIPRFRDELLSLSSNPLSNIANVIWNSSQLRYVPNTTASKVYNKSFYFTQEYDSIIQSTLIDTGNTPILDDIILLDYNEIVQRTVTLYDTSNTRSISTTYTIAAADTFEYHTVTSKLSLEVPRPFHADSEVNFNHIIFILIYI